MPDVPVPGLNGFTWNGKKSEDFPFEKSSTGWIGRQLVPLNYVTQIRQLIIPILVCKWLCTPLEVRLTRLLVAVSDPNLLLNSNRIWGDHFPNSQVLLRQLANQGSPKSSLTRFWTTLQKMSKPSVLVPWLPSRGFIHHVATLRFPLFNRKRYHKMEQNLPHPGGESSWAR